MTFSSFSRRLFDFWAENVAYLLSRKPIRSSQMKVSFFKRRFQKLQESGHPQCQSVLLSNSSLCARTRNDILFRLSKLDTVKFLLGRRECVLIFFVTFVRNWINVGYSYAVQLVSKRINDVKNQENIGMRHDQWNTNPWCFITHLLNTSVGGIRTPSSCKRGSQEPPLLLRFSKFQKAPYNDQIIFVGDITEDYRPDEIRKRWKEKVGLTEGIIRTLGPDPM